MANHVGQADRLEERAEASIIRSNRLTVLGGTVALAAMAVFGFFGWRDISDQFDDLDAAVVELDTAVDELNESGAEISEAGQAIANAVTELSCSNTEQVASTIAIIDALVAVFAARGDTEDPVVAASIVELARSRNRLEASLEECRP